MSFIDMALGEAVERHVVPEGEYDLVIEDAKWIEAKEAGKAPRISVRLSVDGEDGAKSVFHNISLPGPSDDEEKINTKLLFTKAFLDLFKIPYEGGGFELEDFYGARASAHLAQREYEGQVNNEIKLSF